MHTRCEPQGEAFYRCCLDFEKVANDYLSSQKDRANKSIFSFFTSRSMGETISDLLLELVRKVTFSIDFPYVSHGTREIFLDECNKLYKQLTHAFHFSLKSHQITDDLSTFGRQFSQILKRTVYLVVGGEFESSDIINLTYLDYYLDQITVGLDCYSNDFWLKMEASALISNYIERFPKSDVAKMAIPLLESIENDQRGVNKHAKNNKEKFDNLLNLINTFCLCLIDTNEKDLHSDISHIIYRALDLDANFSMNPSLHIKEIDSSDYHELLGLVKLR
jgi:hypothetical protein